MRNFFGQTSPDVGRFPARTNKSDAYAATLLIYPELFDFYLLLFNAIVSRHVPYLIVKTERRVGVVELNYASMPGQWRFWRNPSLISIPIIAAGEQSRIQ